MKLVLLRLALLAVLGLGVSPLTAQEIEAPVVESSRALVRGIELEYFEVGGSGVPLVWVQGIHDMFRPSTFGREAAEQWVAFLRRFSDNHRVIGTVRRGWGTSEDPGYGFDVATQAEDVLGLLDALGIDKAIFVGRTLATQDVMWIAEHHPERALGVVFLETPLIRGTDSFVVPSPVVDEWARMYNRGACDVGVGSEVDRRLVPRNGYRPHFYDDRNRRIQVPALVYLHPTVDRGGRSLRRLAAVESGEIQGEQECDPEVRAYFAALRRDEALMGQLRAAFAAEVDIRTDVREALQEVFEERLTMTWGDGQMGIEPWFRPMRDFLANLTTR